MPNASYSEPKYKEYMIISSSYRDSLVGEINDYLLEGFILIGGMAVSEAGFYQAIAKEIH